MTRVLAEVSKTLKVIGHPRRPKMLRHMVDGERSVGELAASIVIREPAASPHLAVLRRDDLVQPRREGQAVRYAIARPIARVVIPTLFDFYRAPSAIPQIVQTPLVKTGA